MPKVTSSMRKGNQGESIVAARLTPRCLVRPVTQGTDIGIDLYCETLKGDRPFLHFWMQVKSGEQCKPSPDLESASYRFKTDELAYWFRQPVPVFAALVPLSSRDVYIVDISRYLLFNGIPEKSKVKIVSNFRWRDGDLRSVEAFIDNVVPDNEALLSLKKGVISTVQTLDWQYTQSVPIGPVLEYNDKILEQIRRTAAFSMLHIPLNNNESFAKEFRHRLAGILEVFGDQGNWEIHAARGRFFHGEEAFDRAAELYERAAQSIRDDQNVNQHPAWIKRAQVSEYLAGCARKHIKCGECVNMP